MLYKSELKKNKKKSLAQQIARRGYLTGGPATVTVATDGSEPLIQTGGSQRTRSASDPS